MSIVFPWGSAVNMAAIIVGSLIGMGLGDRLPERARSIVFQGLGLCIVVMGVQMAMESKAPLLLIGSVVLGGLFGELAALEEIFTRGGDALKRRLGSKNPVFTEGFVTTTVLFCIGSLAILGPFEEALAGRRTILYTKTILDFFASIAFASRFGAGVLCSGFSVFLYQGAFTLFASALQPILTPARLAELIAVGGILVMAISINMLRMAAIRTSNLLPALAFAAIFGMIFL